MEEGMRQGMQQGQKITAVRMLKSGKYTLDEITDISGLSLDEIQTLRKSQINIWRKNFVLDAIHRYKGAVMEHTKIQWHPAFVAAMNLVYWHIYN